MSFKVKGDISAANKKEQSFQKLKTKKKPKG
jgi:hypothetical protein